MKDLLAFIGDHPVITFFVVYMVCELIFKVINRTLRHWSIRKHGYPPPHCDADGDSKPVEAPGESNG